MTTQYAANFALETIKDAKQAMIEHGVSDPQIIFATCRKLSAMLNLDFELVVELLTNV